jgi:N-acetyl sugar amidotransferase
MRYCKKCVMPDSRPGLKFDEDGVCYACKAAERAKNTDWKQRWKELEALADKYRGCNGDSYDCIITVSGGKDSHYQTYIFKEKLKMNPLLVSIDNFSWTETGRKNWSNLLSTFGCDAHVFSLNPQVCKKMFKIALEELGSPTWYFDRAIYAYPIQIAIKLGIQLIVYGENTAYERGGPGGEKETPSAMNQINNDVVKKVDWDFFLKRDKTLSMKDFNPCIYPSMEEIQKAKLNPVFLSYYTKWSAHDHMEFARSRGFKTLDDTGEWKRQGFAEQYDQIDTIGYVTHTWFKFPKFGHCNITDRTSLWIREGRMTREEAVKMVLAEDWKLDPKVLADFLTFIDNYPIGKFLQVAEKFANKDIVEKQDGWWKLKKNVQEALIKGGEVKP